MVFSRTPAQRREFTFAAQHRRAKFRMGGDDHAGSRVVVIAQHFTLLAELLVERLGLRPHLLVQWKRMLRDVGVVDVQVQDWTSGEPGGPSTK